MSTELFYLFLTSVLLAVMWIPNIVGQVYHYGPLHPEEYQNLRGDGYQIEKSVEGGGEILNFPV